MRYCFIILFLLSGLLVKSQHQEKVDFINAEVYVTPLPETKELKGTVNYGFTVLEKVDSVFLDAKNIHINQLTLNGKSSKFKVEEDHIVISHSFKKGKSYTLRINFKGTPKQTLYFTGWNDAVVANEQIWTQGQGKYTSHWLPSLDDMEDKIEFDLKINAMSQYEVIANGKLVSKVVLDDKTVDWSFDMKNPMSSYLVAFAIGNYHKQEVKSASGISIENYYYPQDSQLVEPTYRYTKEIFDFLETEIGVPYPWQNYKQIPVKDFLYAGMENTGTTIFSDGFVIDSVAFIDKNYINVNAHELAHQWFGNLVTETSAAHHWLHEGFATYYANLAEKKLFGDDHFYWKLFQSADALQAMEDRGEGQSLLDPKASSLVFYEKGALALFMLRQEMGDVAFRKGIMAFLNEFQYKSVTVPDFIGVMEMVGNIDLSGFNNKWLKNIKIPMADLKAALSANALSLRQLYFLLDEINSSEADEIDFNNYWENTNSVHFKRYILSNFVDVLPNEIFNKALESDTIPIRQELLLLSSKKQLSLENLEGLLTDKSYVTIENALIQLWSKYPENRFKYLEATKGIVGLPNKNVRILWLTLAILTEGYDGKLTKVYFDELSGYTAPIYSYEVREIALEYLKQAFGFTEKNLLDLMEATTHHIWQFKKFARTMVDDLLKDPIYKERLIDLQPKLKPAEKRYIKTKLD